MYTLFISGFLSVLAAALLSTAPVHAQDQVVTCASASSDTDNDGWGWENNASCRVDTASDQTTAACVDTDGDGYGWNGIATCLTEQNTTDSTEPSTARCIDSDGDGYGWDGTQTCVVQEPVPTTSGSDAKWRVCGLTEVQAGSSWGRIQVGPRSYRTCVRQCAEDSSVALPQFPGWGYDNQFNAQCVLASTTDTQQTVNSNTVHSIPMYVPNEQPQKLVFERELAYPLYAGDGTWECNQQTRMGIDKPFQSTGYTDNLQFDVSGELKMWRSGSNPEDSTTNDSNKAAWFFVVDGQIGRDIFFAGDNSATRVIGLTDPNDTDSDGVRHGYLQLDRNDLSIYWTAFERKVCQRITQPPAVNLPKSVEEIQALPVLSLNEVLDKPMQCTPFEHSVLTNCSRCEGHFFKPQMLSATTDDVQVQFFSTDELGDERYLLGPVQENGPQDSLTTYTTNGREFNNGDLSNGWGHVVFKQYDAFILREQRFWWRHNTLFAEVTYSSCN